MGNWPVSVVQEVAERRAVFVLGAGVSMGSEDAHGNRPPSWSKLLQMLADSLPDPREKKFALKLVKKERFLEAAQVVQEGVAPAEFSRIMRETLKEKDFQPSRIHKAVFEIDPKVVVTTNYDEIYEKQIAGAGGHVVCRYYEDHVINDLRSGQRCILKMHGCVSDPSKIVLSKTSYFAARRDYPAFFNAIDALFLVSTLIFIGVSMEDPDLQIILENNNISAPSKHHHFIIIEKMKHDSLRNILLKNYNMNPLEYKVGKHGEAADMLEELKAEVIEWRATHD